MKKIKFITLSMLFAATASFAQEEVVATEPAATPTGLTVSGSVDAYYQRAITSVGDYAQVPGTSFTQQNGFALGMGNVILGYEGAKTGFVLDLVTGPRGAGATFSNDIVDGIVNQAYVYWNVSDKTTLTFGRWNTFVGYEVISPVANFNYSTSYLFSNGPFSHLGLKANFELSEDFTAMLAITNPWDTNDVTMTDEVAYGAQLGYKGQYLNLYYDSGHNGGLGFVIDYTGGFDVTEDFYLGINAAYNRDFKNNPATPHEGYYGAALYPQYAISDSFSLGLRGEYFSMYEGVAEDSPYVIAGTLTGSYTVENLTIKPELRLDTIFSTDDSVKPFSDMDGLPTDNLAVFTLAAIYAF